MLPILTFKKYGKTKGKSYIHTTVLVDRGVYSVVRHPQYLAGILIAVALALIVQHWIVAVLGALLIFIYYMDTYAEERDVTQKFGEDYERYKKSVPRVNFIAGLIRLLCRRIKKQ